MNIKRLNIPRTKEIRRVTIKGIYLFIIVSICKHGSMVRSLNDNVLRCELNFLISINIL